VRDVTLQVAAGETLGIVGESGCGKSTTAKMMLRLLEPDAGGIYFDGADVARLRGRRLRESGAGCRSSRRTRRPASIRADDPGVAEFNLRRTACPQSDPGTARPRRPRPVPCEPLPAPALRRQLQRAAIARALSPNRAGRRDEAVSALDKSVQAQVLNLLADLQRDLGIAYVFISHDLAVVEHLADRVAVMYSAGWSRRRRRPPLARRAPPYTTTLLSSTPGLGRERIVLKGELPSRRPPSGSVSAPAARSRSPPAPRNGRR